MPDTAPPLGAPPALPPPPPVPPPPTAGPVPNDRLLPPRRGKLGRVQAHVEGAVDGLQQWVELRIELARREMQEKIEALRRDLEEKAKYGVLMAVFGLLAGLFLLLTIGFGFSALYVLTGMGQLAALTAGYGTLTLLLALGAGIAYLKSPFRNSGS